MGEIQPEVVPQPPTDQVDDAVVYLKDHQNEALDSQVDLSALRRKIDRRLMPYMFCCYVLQFLDKVMLNVSLTFNSTIWNMLLMQGCIQYAAVMGIKKDLGLVGNEFSNVATWVFIAYLIAEVPNGAYFYSSPQNFLGVSLLSPNFYSILLTESTPCQMARRKCFPLGSRGCRLRWRPRISEPARSSNFLGYF